MRKCLKVCIPLMMSAVLLTACGKEDYTTQKSAMLTKLSEKYAENFYVVDMSKRSTSDVNSQGDVYYAYVGWNAQDDRYHNKGFYCEINSTLTVMQDSFLDVCLQPALEGRYKRYVPEDATVVGLVSTQGDEIITKYTYANIVSNKIPYTVNVIMPMSVDMAAYTSGETEALQFKRIFEELKKSSYASVNIVYCDEEYMEEYIQFTNHMLPFDYKVDYTKIYADASLNTGSSEDVTEQFVRQINNDLAMINAER